MCLPVFPFLNGKDFKVLSILNAQGRKSQLNLLKSVMDECLFLELILTGDEKCLIYRKMLKEKRIFIHIVRQMVKFDKKINLNERIFFLSGWCKITQFILRSWQKVTTAWLGYVTPFISDSVHQQFHLMRFWRREIKIKDKIGKFFLPWNNHKSGIKLL